MPGRIGAHDDPTPNLQGRSPPVRADPGRRPPAPPSAPPQDAFWLAKRHQYLELIGEKAAGGDRAAEASASWPSGVRKWSDTRGRKDKPPRGGLIGLKSRVPAQHEQVASIINDQAQREVSTPARLSTRLTWTAFHGLPRLVVCPSSPSFSAIARRVRP